MTPTRLMIENAERVEMKDLLERMDAAEAQAKQANDAARYRFLRTLNMPQFAELFKLNAAGHARFDDLVDTARLLRAQGDMS